MPDALPDLESRRSEIVKQLARLGDLRSGSISNTSGRCGKPNCHCHQPDQPVHGPNSRLTYKEQGKTITESLPTPAAQKKAEREIAEFRRFEQLVREFIEVNAKICRVRPMEQGQPLSQEKKTTAAACEKAVSTLEHQFQRIFADRHRTGHLDLEAVEMAIRSTVHQTGADAVSELLRFDPPDTDHRSLPCDCGHAAQYVGMRSRPLLTAVGWARIDRPYYLCSECSQGQFPADVQLGIDKTDYSPGVRRMLAAVGSEMPFVPGRQQLKLLADLEVTAKAIERTAESIGADIEVRQQQDIRKAKQLCLPAMAGSRIPHLYVQMDGTQVFVVKSETEGRAGRTPGQPARTRECKLGCVFTQTGVDDQGRSVRDEGSTTYVGAIETAEDFGLRIYTEAYHRGWDRATIRVVIGDGSHWIWNLADRHFPGAIQIVDLYHACEHLWDLARKLHPGDEVAQKRWLRYKLDWLEKGKIEKLVAALRMTADSITNPEFAKTIGIEAEYFDSNRDRMRYPEFRQQNLFVGSGVIEAGCKTVIGSRLKQSGMFWTVRGANAIIALRCCCVSGKFEAYWEGRAA